MNDGKGWFLLSSKETSDCFGFFENLSKHRYPWYVTKTEHPKKRMDETNALALFLVKSCILIHYLTASALDQSVLKLCDCLVQNL